MKRILLMMFAALMCLSAFSGCAKECDHNWQRTANFDQHTAVDKCTICEETRMYTDRDSLPAQASKFPAEPSHLSVSDDISTIQAWRGTYSWYVENEDGTGSGICADSSHPLECKDKVPAIKVAQKTTLTLNLEGNPSKITVKRYNLSTNDHDSYKEIAANGNQIEVKAGDYLYEVIASWSSQTYNGTVYYAFRTEK
ncbi:MAG: hypothetical protein IKK01_06900 [Clostridia bacterium]|nr:hypothetical protein [Clostridia bacterium]